MTSQYLVDRRAPPGHQPRQPSRPEVRPRSCLKDPLLLLGGQLPWTRLGHRPTRPQTRPARPLVLTRGLPAPPPPVRRRRRNAQAGRGLPERRAALDQLRQFAPPTQSELAPTVFHVRPPSAGLS